MPFQVTTPGRVMLADVLPEDMKDMVNTPMDKKALKSFFAKLATQHPDEYIEVMHKMAQLGNEVSTEYGRWMSLSLKDLKVPPAIQAYRNKILKRVKAITQNPKLSPEQKNDLVVKEMVSHIDESRKLVEEEAVKAGNAFGYASRYGFRGNPMQLTQILLGDVLMTDSKNRPIPLPMLHGYASGLTPLETYAGSYGARKGYLCLGTGTKVRMWDGSSKEIQEIKSGDVVTGFNLRTHQIESAPVLALVDNGIQGLWTYYFYAGEVYTSLIASENHWVYQYPSNRWSVPVVAPLSKPARTMRMINAAAPTLTFWQFDSADTFQHEQAWDLSIKTDDHLFVLANGMVVSNSVQFATADTGYFAKQMQLLSTGQQVLSDDCGTTDGIPAAPSSPAAIGHVLVQDAGALKAGTVLDADNTRKLRASEVIVRSPLTCKLPRGVCKKCVGLRPNGKWAPLKSFIGVESARVLSEPLTQSLALSAKHSGVSAKAGVPEISGFPEINQFLQIPDSFQGATHSEVDGTVMSMEKAPQGGFAIKVGDTDYHIPEGRTPSVKVGDSVYAGDALSDGTMNPALVAQYKGIGEGRKYFAEKLAEILDRNGVPGHRSNIDVVARAFINNVQVTHPDGVGGFNYGEVVPYDLLQNRWTPRKDAKLAAPKSLKGMYLEAPTLHYTVGTRLTPTVIADLQKRGVKQVTAHPQDPGFQPYITRAAARSLNEMDWKARLAGFYLGKAFQEMATKGATDSPGGMRTPFSGLMNPELMDDVEDLD